MTLHLTSKNPIRDVFTLNLYIHNVAMDNGPFEDVQDSLVGNDFHCDFSLPEGKNSATGTTRCGSQLSEALVLLWNVAVIS